MHNKIYQNCVIAIKFTETRKKNIVNLNLSANQLYLLKKTIFFVNFTNNENVNKV